MVTPNDKQNEHLFGEGRDKYLTDIVFLLGNGSSRKDFDLERLRPIGTIIGCNAIYRDFNPDILVSIDSKMLNEINSAKYDKSGMVILPHNRSVNVANSFRYRTGKYNTSGCFAMRLIKDAIKPSKCYMLGMDAYPGNMYDGTKNYAVHTLKNFQGVHNHYRQVLEQSGNTIFINVNEQDGWPPECENTGKYKFITYDEFEKEVFS